jgi:hypothetical protein
VKSQSLDVGRPASYTDVLPTCMLPTSQHESRRAASPCRNFLARARLGSVGVLVQVRRKVGWHEGDARQTRINNLREGIVGPTRRRTRLRDALLGRHSVSIVVAETVRRVA